jgi:hypothetical protein
MKIKFIGRAIFFYFLITAGLVWAQDPEWMEHAVLAPLAGSGEVDWKNQFTFYGDNTEFYEPFRVRETILGQQFDSYLDASASDHVDLWGGLFVNHPSAQEVETDAQPILSFIYHTDVSQFIFGTLQPVYRHGLIEPMEVTTLELTRPIEYGLEWVQKDNFINLDSFLNWQQILTDVDREIFDYGGSSQLPLASGVILEGQCHGYHVGGANVDALVRNNLAAGIGLAFKPHLPVLGSSSIEIFGLGSKDSDRPNYPGPTYGEGLYTKIIISPDDRWQFFGISWFGKDYMSEEGDSNYNSLGADGVYYESNRTYEELGLRRFVEIEKGVTFDFELRSHWIDTSWANSFRIEAFVPFDVLVGVHKKEKDSEEGS